MAKMKLQKFKLTRVFTHILLTGRRQRGENKKEKERGSENKKKGEREKERDISWRYEIQMKEQKIRREKYKNFKVRGH